MLNRLTDVGGGTILDWILGRINGESEYEH